MENIDKNIVLDYLNNSVGGYFEMCKCGEIVNLARDRDGDNLYSQCCIKCNKWCCKNCFVYLGTQFFDYLNKSYLRVTYSCLDCESKHE